MTTIGIGNTREMDKRVEQDVCEWIPEQQLKTALYDPYVKAFRWASDRIGDEGVVAFVTNNSFLDGTAFDGMRKHLAEDFDAIYIMNLRWKRAEGIEGLENKRRQRFWTRFGSV